MKTKVLQWIGWAMIALGIILAVLFVSGLTHPVSAEVPSTMSSYNSHHRWVVIGWTVPTTGAVLLLVATRLRGARKAESSTASASPSE